jgi:hypothetical protein
MTECLHNAQTPERIQLEHDTAEKVFVAAGRLNSSEPEVGSDLRHRYFGCFSNFSDATLHLIAKTSGTDLALALFNTLLYGEESEDYLVDWMMLDPVHPDGTFQIRYCINGLAHAPHLEPRTDGHYPQRRIDQAVALFRLAGYLDDIGIRSKFKDPNNGNSNTIYITDEKLRTLLMTHKNPGLIADLFIERGLRDVDQISAVADSMEKMAPALTNGAL